MTNDEWITQEVAAERLHVALDTMRRYVREGLFPRAKVGKRYLIPATAINDFLQSRLQHGPMVVTPRVTPPAPKKTATTKKAGKNKL